MMLALSFAKTEASLMAARSWLLSTVALAMKVWGIIFSQEGNIPSISRDESLVSPSVNMIWFWFSDGEMESFSSCFCSERRRETSSNVRLGIRDWSSFLDFRGIILWLKRKPSVATNSSLSVLNLVKMPVKTGLPSSTAAEKVIWGKESKSSEQSNSTEALEEKGMEGNSSDEMPLKLALKLGVESFKTSPTESILTSTAGRAAEASNKFLTGTVNEPSSWIVAGADLTTPTSRLVQENIRRSFWVWRWTLDNTGNVERLPAERATVDKQELRNVCCMVALIAFGAFRQNAVFRPRLF